MLKAKFTINQHPIQEYSEVFIIAEAGVNHNQKLDLALKLVDVAADSGADVVKFQTFTAEQLVTKQGRMAAYQKKNLGREISQQEMLKEVELPESFYSQIIKRCRKKKILFMSTPHGGRSSVKLLEKFKTKAYKISSADLTNFILLDEAAKTQKPIILSSGMATLAEVKNAIKFIRSRANFKICVLHCTTNYPCPPNEVNLRAMKTMMEKLDVPVGFSDHTDNSLAGIGAAFLGMAVYECHFTLDKNLPGPDHIASAEPEELKQRIKAIRDVAIILGKSEKIPNKNEVKAMLPQVRKSIIAAADLETGHILTEKDLEAKRPANGLSPIFYQKLLNKKIKRRISKDEIITLKDI